MSLVVVVSDFVLNNSPSRCTASWRASKFTCEENQTWKDSNDRQNKLLRDLSCDSRRDRRRQRPRRYFCLFFAKYEYVLPSPLHLSNLCLCRLHPAPRTSVGSICPRRTKFSRAVSEVWRAYEMKQKPAFILDVRLPSGSFDVNVTPDKREIFMTDVSC